MNKHLLTIATFLVVSAGAVAQVTFKDAELLKLNELAGASTGKASETGRNLLKGVKAGADGKINLIIRYSDESALDEIKANGGEVVSLVGYRTAIVNVAVGDAVAVAGSRGVSGASLPAKLKHANDVALPFSNVTDVHNGTGLPSSFDGKDVIVGLFDVGVDPNHINFKDGNGNSRVQTVFYYPDANAIPEIYDTPQTIATFSSDTRSESHGTHVLGVMAGSFADFGTSGAPDYRGVAPGSEIVVACGDGYNVQILDGIERIAKYASEKGKPCVINLSFGDNMGPHDGTDEFTEAINDVAEKYNVSIFLAVGNEREDKSYIIKQLTEDDPSVKTLATKGSAISSTTVQCSSEVEIWTEDDTPFTVSLDIISKTKPNEVLYSFVIPEKRSGYVSQGDIIDQVVDTRRCDLITEGTVFHSYYSSSFMGGVAGVDSYNKRYNAQLMLHLESRTAAYSNRYFVRITVTGQPGKKIFIYGNEEYINFANKSIQGLDVPNGNGSNSNMASGPNTISVGSYVSNNYPGSGYQEGTVGDLSYFSSFGETLYGRVQPDICAPGQVIVSSRNSDLSSSYDAYYPKVYSYKDNTTRKTYYWTLCAGTSQATPHAAGVAALWLQANPDLTYSDIRAIAQETATDGGTATPGWGAGKINALAGIKKALQMSGVDGITVDKAEDLYIEPLGNGVYEVFSAAGDNVTASVYSLQGAELLRAASADGSLTVSAASLPAGVYVLRVSTPNSTKALKVTNL